MHRKIPLSLLFALGCVGWLQAEIPLSPTLAWAEVAPGVWKTTVGVPEPLTLLSAAGATVPASDALRAMPKVSFPLAPEAIEGRVLDHKTSLRFPLAANEDIYGLGVAFGKLRRNGDVFELHVDHWDSKRGITGRTHAPVPLYISMRGFGVLFDTARYLRVSVGHGVRLAATEKPPVIDRTTNRIMPTQLGEAPKEARWQADPRSDAIEAVANADGMDVYVFAGPSPLQALQRYNLFVGGGALPPKWGLGFLARMPTRSTAKDVLAEIAEFRQRGLPLDMIGLEPGWMNHAYPCSFEWDATRFPEPKAFLAEVQRQNVRVNLWFNPYVGPTSAPLYQALLPFAGTHLVWNGLVPDYSLPEARTIFAEHLHQTVMDLNPAAVGGFKIDEVDGYDRYLWPDTAVFPSGRSGEQLRQTYGLLLQRTVYDAFHAQNRRTMGQVRGTNAGASRFPFVLYNDNYEFDGYITAVANSGFAGVLWSPEVRGSDSGIDMLRRTQAVCFSPLALYNGWASTQKLWTHADAADGIREAILLRLRLLPYLYTTFAEYHFRGTPPVRPMPLVMASGGTETRQSGQLDATANPYEVSAAAREAKDQYLLGESLLVAPIDPKVKSRRVVLPPGRWYDFYTGQLAGENETIEVTPAPDRMPLYVRDGALIPLLAPRLSTPRAGEIVPLEIRHYGTASGQIMVYDDDGETFDFEKGAYCWTKLAVAKDASGTLAGSVTLDANGHRWSYGDVVFRFMSAPEAR